MSDFKSDLKDSASDFLRVVWPIVQRMVGGGKIIPIESVTDDAMTKMLDAYSGIDAWHLSNDRQVRGVASRVQWVTDWNTFTVRYSRDSGTKTEYEKRKADIDSNAGWLYPHLTVQAFISGNKGSGGDLMSVAVMETKTLINICENVIKQSMLGNNNVNHGIRRTGNAKFIYVNWDWIKSSGNKIKIHRPNPAFNQITTIKAMPQAQIFIPHIQAPAYQQNQLFC